MAALANHSGGVVDLGSNRYASAVALVDSSGNPVDAAAQAAFRVDASLTRPANATPYTAKDVIAAATLAVTGTAAGTGGVVRLTLASTAALFSGQAVTVASVGGTTEANGDRIITVVDATHIDLIGTVFANAWTSGGTIQSVITLLAVGRANGGSVRIDNVRRHTTDLADIVAHRLWFYASPRTQLADNAPFTLLNATGGRPRYVDLPAQTTEGSGSDITYAQNIAVNLHLICLGSDTALYVVDETITGFTPTTGAVVSYEVIGYRD